MTRGRLAVHAHFYQPLRADPFSGHVAQDPSAAPFHDWNARISAECYRPNLERGNDGIVHLTNLQLYSPKLRLAGAGQRFRDGTFHIVGSGRQAKYGPVKMVLDGHIERHCPTRTERKIC